LQYAEFIVFEQQDTAATGKIVVVNNRVSLMVPYPVLFREKYLHVLYVENRVANKNDLIFFLTIRRKCFSQNLLI
jgi:hypothetical protein